MLNMAVENAEQNCTNNEQPNNKLCNILVIAGTNQWHNIGEIYNVHLR